jgi:hypothetical protein
MAVTVAGLCLISTGFATLWRLSETASQRTTRIPAPEGFTAPKRGPCGPLDLQRDETGKPLEHVPIRELDPAHDARTTRLSAR